MTIKMYFQLQDEVRGSSRNFFYSTPLSSSWNFSNFQAFVQLSFSVLLSIFFEHSCLVVQDLIFSQPYHKNVLFFWITVHFCQGHVLETQKDTQSNEETLCIILSHQEGSVFLVYLYFILNALLLYSSKIGHSSTYLTSNSFFISKRQKDIYIITIYVRLCGVWHPSNCYISVFNHVQSSRSTFRLLLVMQSQATYRCGHPKTPLTT